MFRIQYVTSSNPSAIYDPQFKKIKSLFYINALSCPRIQPNLVSIPAPLCQVTNHAITFNNINWSTYGESPDYCFGSVPTYEYQLPNQWSIGGFTSTGSNWIQGGNSVIVTTDLSNGDGSTIKIRPRNNCGSNLENGQPPVQIPISRPAPTLSITGPEYICSGNQSFTINGMPSGASVQWSVSNTTEASIASGGTSPTVTISRIGSANTVITLTATVTNCTFTYTKPKDIALGILQPGPIEFTLIDFTFGKIKARIFPVPGADYYQWYKNSVLVTLPPAQGPGIQIPISRTACDIEYDISVEAVNSCGVSTQSHANAYVPCDGFYMLSPNPASNNITISSDQRKAASEQKTFSEIRIYDLAGNLKKLTKYNKVRSAGISISDLSNGIYTVEITEGGFSERKQLMIQRQD